MSTPIPTFDELIERFPCISDPNDFNYSDRIMRGKVYAELLKLCNVYSNTKLTLIDIRRKAKAYKRRRQLEEAKDQTSHTAPVPPTLPSASSSTKTKSGKKKNEPIAAQHTTSPHAVTSPAPQSTTHWRSSTNASAGPSTTGRNPVESVGPSTSNVVQDPLDISKEVLPQCRFCAKFTKECIDLCIDNGDSVKNNITIVFNEVSVVVDLNNRELPKTVCSACDISLQEMYKFVNKVNDAQKSLVKVCNNVKEEFEEDIKEECEPDDLVLIEDSDNDANDNNDAIEDSVTFTETELVPQTVLIPKRKVHETEQMKAKAPAKKIKVTVDSLNSELIIESDIVREEDDVNSVYYEQRGSRKDSVNNLLLYLCKKGS